MVLDIIYKQMESNTSININRQLIIYDVKQMLLFAETLLLVLLVVLQLALSLAVAHFLAFTAYLQLLGRTIAILTFSCHIVEYFVYEL